MINNKKRICSLVLLFIIFFENIFFYNSKTIVNATDTNINNSIPYEYFNQTEWSGESTGIGGKNSDTMYNSKDTCITSGTSLSATSIGCTIISRIIDFGEKKEFLGTYFEGSKPTDDGLETSRNYFLYVRTGNNTNLDDSLSWSSWHMIGNDFFNNLQNTRYLQYKIVFQKTGKTIDSFEIKYRKTTNSYESVGDKTLYSNGVGNISEPAKLFEYNLGGQLGYSQIIYSNSLNSGDFKLRDQVFMVLGGKIVVKNPKTNDLLWTTDVLGVSEIIGIYDLLGDGNPYIVASTTGPTSVAIFDARGGKNPVWQYTYNSESYGMSYSNVFVDDLDGDNKLDLVTTGQYHFKLSVFNFDTGFKSNPLENLKTGTQYGSIAHHPVLMSGRFVSKTEKNIFYNSFGSTETNLFNKNGILVSGAYYSNPNGSWPGRGTYISYDKKNESNSIQGIFRVGESSFVNKITNFNYDITGVPTVQVLDPLGENTYIPKSYSGSFGNNGLNIIPVSYFTGSTWNTSFFDLGTNPGTSILTGSKLSGERILGLVDLNNDGISDFITMDDTNSSLNKYGKLNFYEVTNSPTFSYVKKLSTTSNYKLLPIPIRKSNSITDSGQSGYKEILSLGGKILLEESLPNDKSTLGFYTYNDGTISKKYSREYDASLIPQVNGFSNNIDQGINHISLGYLNGNVELINVTTDTPTLDYLFTTGGFNSSFPLVTNLNGKNVICLSNSVKDINCLDGTNAKLSFPPQEVLSIKNTGFDNIRVALGDIDNDNNPEIGYTTYDGNNYYLNLKTITYTGGLTNSKSLNLGINPQKFGITFGYFKTHNTSNKYYKDIYSIAKDLIDNSSIFNYNLQDLFTFTNSTTGSNHGQLDIYDFDNKGSGFSSIINQYFRWQNGYNGSVLYGPGLDNWQSMTLKSGFSGSTNNNILYTGSNGHNYWLGNALNGAGIVSKSSEYSLKHMRTGEFSSAAAKLTNSNLGYILAVGTADGEVTFNYTNSGTTKLANVFNYGSDFTGTGAGYFNQSIKFINGKTYNIYVKNGGNVNSGPFIYTNLNNGSDIIDTSVDLKNYNTSTSVRAAGDINGDGKIEFIVTDGKGYLYVVDSVTGKVVWSYNEGFFIKHLILADVNNDGMLNILYVTSEGKLVALGNKSLNPPTYVYDGYSQGEDTNLIAEQGIIGANWGEVYGAVGYNYKVVIKSGDTTVDFIDWKNTTSNYLCLVGTNYSGAIPDGCISIGQKINYSTQTTYAFMVQAYNSSGVSDIKTSDGFSYGTIDISKLVKGPKDSFYKTSTEIYPGQMVTYKIKIQNNWDQVIGGEGVNKLIVYDYMPKSAYYVPNSTRVLNLGLLNPSIPDESLITEGSTLKTDKGTILIWKMPNNITIEKGKYIEVLFNAKFD